MIVKSSAKEYKDVKALQKVFPRSGPHVFQGRDGKYYKTNDRSRDGSAAVARFLLGQAKAKNNQLRLTDMLKTIE